MALPMLPPSFLRDESPIWPRGDRRISPATRLALLHGIAGGGAGLSVHGRSSPRRCFAWPSRCRKPPSVLFPISAGLLFPAAVAKRDRHLSGADRSADRTRGCGGAGACHPCRRKGNHYDALLAKLAEGEPAEQAIAACFAVTPEPSSLLGENTQIAGHDLFRAVGGSDFRAAGTRRQRLCRCRGRRDARPVAQRPQIHLACTEARPDAAAGGVSQTGRPRRPARHSRRMTFRKAFAPFCSTRITGLPPGSPRRWLRSRMPMLRAILQALARANCRSRKTRQSRFMLCLP